MARNSFSYTHADAGSKPGSSLDFKKNGRPDAQNFDWWWDSVIKAINAHADEFDRLDSDNDGIVDKADLATQADNAAKVNGNNIDSDEDGRVNAADDATEIQGNTPDDLRLAIEDGGTLVLSAVPNANFGNGLSVTKDGDGTVTITADTQADTHTDVSSAGTLVVSNVDDINAGANLEAVDDGDDTITFNVTKVDEAANADAVDGPDGREHVAGSAPEFSDVTTGENNTARGDKFVVEQSDGYHEYLVE